MTKSLTEAKSADKSAVLAAIVGAPTDGKMAALGTGAGLPFIAAGCGNGSLMVPTTVPTMEHLDVVV